MGEYQQYPSVSIVFPRQTQQFVERLNGEYQQYPAIFVEALLRGNDFAKGSRCIRGGGSHS